MSKIYVVQSPQLHVLVFGSQDVHFQSLIIKSPEASPNTDGIHISHSDHVTVQASVIGTGIYIFSLLHFSVLQFSLL